MRITQRCAFHGATVSRARDRDHDFLHPRIREVIKKNPYYYFYCWPIFTKLSSVQCFRYGKLWDHLEIYFTSGYVTENLDTDVTCLSSQEKDEESGFDRNSLASSGSSTNDQDLSRLESSTFTDTVSCESLSSHDENYFDLIEDYARAKSQKLKEIQNFNERRKHVESLRPVKKTISQVDLKSLDDTYEQHRSHSLTDLARDDDNDSCANDAVMYRSVNDGSMTDVFRFTPSDDEDKGKDFPPLDIDTQQLLRNAQRLIESINETLSKGENCAKDDGGGDQTAEGGAIDAPVDEVQDLKRADNLVAEEFANKSALVKVSKLKANI